MSDEVHRERLQLFCRLCEFKIEGRNLSCSSVSGEVKAVYGEDLTMKQFTPEISATAVIRKLREEKI